MTGAHSHLAPDQKISLVIALFGLISFLSIAFEEFEHHLRHLFHESPHYEKMLDASFKELTILGFVGLTLMVLVKSGAVEQLAVQGLGDSDAAEGLVHLFEEVHLMLFFIMLAFILLVGVLLWQAHVTKRAFQKAENKTLMDMLRKAVKGRAERAERELHGGPVEKTSLSRVASGTMFQQKNFNASPEITLSINKAAVSEESQELIVNAAAVPGFVSDPVDNPFPSHRRSSTDTSFNTSECSSLLSSTNTNLRRKSFGEKKFRSVDYKLDQKMCEYRLHRREFFHPFEEQMGRHELKEAQFDFADYLGSCMAKVAIELIEIPSVSFLTVFLILLACRPAFSLSAREQQVFLVLFAWGICLVLCAVLMLVKRIYYKLLPAHAANIEALEKVEWENATCETFQPRYQKRDLRGPKGKGGNVNFVFCHQELRKSDNEKPTQSVANTQSVASSRQASPQIASSPLRPIFKRTTSTPPSTKKSFNNDSTKTTVSFLSTFWQYVVRFNPLFSFQFWCQTDSPNKHELLFPFWRNGPHLLANLLQLCLFLQGVYLATYVVHILPKELPQIKNAFTNSNSITTFLAFFASEPFLLQLLQFLPLGLGLCKVWPALLYYYTFATSVGMMKNENAIAEVISDVENRQFAKYNRLMRELEVKALIYHIRGMDNYSETGLEVALQDGGVYEKWRMEKIEEFEEKFCPSTKASAKEAFETWDLDESDLLDSEEMRKMLLSQGKKKSEVEDVLRQWFWESAKEGEFRHVFRPSAAYPQQARPPGGGMNFADFKVYLVLENELNEGVFNDKRLAEWLWRVLDASGDGLVSVEELQEAIPEQLFASGLDARGIRKMFKVVTGSSVTGTNSEGRREGCGVEEVEVSTLMAWLRKFAKSRREKRLVVGGRGSSAAGGGH